MTKYSNKTVRKIVDLLKSDTYTIDEICAQVGINPKTYHDWKKNHPEFAEAIEHARDSRMQSFVLAAKNSLMRKITGYDVTERKVTTIPGAKGKDGKPTPKIKEQITFTKHIQPDTAAIIFTLTNGDPEHWRNRQTTEVTGKDGKDLFALKTDKELDKMIDDYNRKLDK